MTNGKVGPGRFQWNTAGWFGSQLGCTTWSGAVALMVLRNDFRSGLILFACFLIPNVIGYLIWRKRFQLNPYPAVQWLLGVCGMGSFVAASILRDLKRTGALEFPADVTPLQVLIVWSIVVVFLFFIDRLAHHKGGGITNG